MALALLRISSFLTVAALCVSVTACSATVASPTTPPASQPAPPCQPGRVAAISEVWDPDFQDESLQAIRGLGGFYRSLRATSFQQSRSLAGPTFRLECGESFEGRLLLGIPQSTEANRPLVLTAFIDYAQSSIEVEGKSAATHRLTLRSGAEHVLRLRTPPLFAGIHRLVIMVFDDDDEPGLFGAVDLFADLYVGPNPVLLALQPAEPPESRSDPVVIGTSYGVALTSSRERLLLVSSVRWSRDLTLWISFWGSVREGERPVALVVLQDFREVDLSIASPILLARPEKVGVLPLRPALPKKNRESIRFVIFSNPALEMAPTSVTVPSSAIFKTYVSQKAYLDRGLP
jgi:hypothetical protein